MGFMAVTPSPGVPPSFPVAADEEASCGPQGLQDLGEVAQAPEFEHHLVDLALDLVQLTARAACCGGPPGPGDPGGIVLTVGMPGG